MLKAQDKGKQREIVYTEDNVPVHTLYLQNIPQLTKEDDIKKHFSEFGEVESVHVTRKRRQSKFKNHLHYGYVTFVQPQSAANALKNRTHERLARGLIVKAADTWKQPKTVQESIKKTESTKNKRDCIKEKMNHKSILELNEDCLHHIFSFLSQNEALKLSFVCQRFFNIIAHRIQVSKYLDLEGMHDDFTLMEVRTILSSFGDHIERLRLLCVNDVYKRYLEFLSKCCHNLEELILVSFRNVDIEVYKRIFQSSKRLKSVTLSDCGVSDSECLLLRGLSSMESLDLSKNFKIKGKNLKYLKWVKKLNVSNSEYIESRYFVNMFKGGIKLKDLNVAGCQHLDEKALQALISTQTELECLEYNHSYFAYMAKVLENLPSLKHVRILRDPTQFPHPEVLCELSTQRQEALETLELYNLPISIADVNLERIFLLKNLKKLCIVRDRGLDDKFLRQIATSCKRLEHVNISGLSRNISESGILDLVENLQNLNFLNVAYNDQLKSTIAMEFIAL